MSNCFQKYVKEVRAVKRNESNQLLKYILKFTDTNHRWSGSLSEFIYLLSRFRKRVNDECNILKSYENDYIFEREVYKIRANLNVRGIEVFVKRSYEKVNVVVNKNLDNDFSGYYFCEEYMMQFF